MGKFPREHRPSLGQRIDLLFLEILEKLIRAKFTGQRRELLESVNVNLQVLRFQVRLIAVNMR